jgi:hypothetical protein
MLERDLVRLYVMQWEVQCVFDDKEYPEWDRSLPDLRKNIANNFPNFGWYKVVLNPDDMTEYNEIGLGDAVDDLHDIIREILEVKWRLEYNSVDNGLWFFKFIFSAHIKEHLIGLLKYLNDLE